MTYVLTADDGPVRVLTLNRPEARNALNPELIGSLYAKLVDADTDPSVRAVVLTGTDPSFCAGVDLKEANRLGSAYFEQFQTQNCITRVAQMATPIVGAINGPVFTGGLEMALGCDFLIASERAVFADTHARVCILPGGGITARLPQLVATGWAAVTDAALAAEQRISGAASDTSDLGERLRAVTDRNRRQIDDAS
ncbi:MAG: enoyl-CoA hydratase-related protein [Mycobacterium sp.]